MTPTNIAAQVFELLLSFVWLIIFLVALAGMWRVLRGPSTLDRMLGLDALTVCIAALIAAQSMREGRANFMELILVVTGMGFLTTVAFYYYLSQKQVKDSTPAGRNHKERTRT